MYIYARLVGFFISEILKLPRKIIELIWPVKNVAKITEISKIREKLMKIIRDL